MPAKTPDEQLLQKWVSFQFIIHLKTELGHFRASSSFKTSPNFKKLMPILNRDMPPTHEDSKIIRDIRNGTHNKYIKDICDLLLGLLAPVDITLKIQGLGTWLNKTVPCADDDTPIDNTTSIPTDRDMLLMAELRNLRIRKSKPAKTIWKLLGQKHINFSFLKSNSHTEIKDWNLGMVNLSCYLAFDRKLIASLITVLHYPDSRLKKLTLVHVRHEACDTEDLARLAAALNASHIESLDLSDSDALALALLQQGLDFSRNPHLKHVSLRGWRKPLEDYLAADITRLAMTLNASTLTSLDLSGSEPLARALFQQGFQPKANPQLSHLSLRAWRGRHESYLAFCQNTLVPALSPQQIAMLDVSSSFYLALTLLQLQQPLQYLRLKDITIPRLMLLSAALNVSCPLQTLIIDNTSWHHQDIDAGITSEQMDAADQALEKIYILVNDTRIRAELAQPRSLFNQCFSICTRYNLFSNDTDLAPPTSSTATSSSMLGCSSNG